VYSRDEAKHHEMFTMRRNQDIRYIVGDIRDREKLFESMKGVDYVFHAAALKHVPTGEMFPEEVVHTNILGTKNVIEAAEYCNVKKVVYLSTDKAAYPVSCYGATKLISERIVMAHKGKTINVCLRYGNVLGSRGSVVPLFLEQIKRKEILTITEPTMTRFILDLNQAVILAMKALSDGNNGDLFVMKPPACTVQTLVDALSLHFGRKLPQKIIGIRDGEKIHETLLTSNEVYRSIEEKEDDITYARISQKHTKDYFFEGDNYIEPSPYSSDSAEQYDAKQVLAKLREANLLKEEVFA
jgi:UDP-glucose 4-epimerase